MFKKIEIWILYLVLLLGIPVTISFGSLVRQELKGNIKLGSVSKTALFLAEIPVNIKKILIANQSSDLKPSQDWDYIVNDFHELADKLGCNKEGCF